MRVAVLGAGGPAGVNTLKALFEAGHECWAHDVSVATHSWLKPYTSRTSVHIEDVLGADVVIPQPDSVVLWAVKAELANALLPAEATVWACQDKFSTALAWWRQCLRESPPIKIADPLPDNLHLARDQFGLGFWLRKTKGAGAAGAVRVTSLDQGYHWLRFWQSRDDESEWIAEEYLPGRDIAWSSIWYQGELVTSFARERLEYLYPHLTPEGLTGTPTVARVVHDDRVNEIAEAAVRAIDSDAHGIFSVDLREDVHGLPRPTEINAGRGFTTFGLWSLYGPNFLDIVVRLAAHGRRWWLKRPDLTEPPTYNALPDGLTLSRHIDCGHTFTRELVAA